MQENNIDKVNTYTVGFDFISYDEFKYAKQISNILEQITMNLPTQKKH